jgi:hypothetical protein
MPVRAITCPGLTSAIEVSMCVNTARSEYAEGTSPDNRKRWLLENGCPAPMVEPDRYVGPQTPPTVVVATPAAQAVQQAAPAVSPPASASLPGRKDGYDPETIHQLTSSYDEFKDRTSTSASISVGSGLRVYLFAISKGRSPSLHVTTMVLGVSEASDKAQHADSPSLIFLIDGGRRLTGRNLSRHESTKEGRVVETISMPLTVQALQAFVGASLIRGQLDTTEFALSPQARSDLRAFAERVGAVTPPPSLDGAEYWLPERRGRAASTAEPASVSVDRTDSTGHSAFPLHRW